MKYLKLRLVFLPVLLVLTVLLCSCSVRKKADAMETDANGYLCDQCNLKFYTEKDVFAAVCPACKPGTPFSVVGYVCAHDNHMTIVRQGKPAICEKCKKPVDAVAIPREANLKAWGAVKKSKSEVLTK